MTMMLYDGLAKQMKANWVVLVVVVSDALGAVEMCLMIATEVGSWYAEPNPIENYEVPRMGFA